MGNIAILQEGGSLSLCGHFQAQPTKPTQKQLHLLNFTIKIIHLNHFHFPHHTFPIQSLHAQNTHILISLELIENTILLRTILT